MATVTTDPRDVVLTALRKRPHRPAELMVLVQHETQLDELSIKDAVSDLLDRRIIEFSPERKLRLREAEQKVS